MNDKINEKTVILPPFKHLIMTIGELPSSYLETMTYYEMLVWFTKYLGDTVIPALNENGEAVTELQGLFTQLQSYVNNYFDNLDVQEEVNTKLDEMAESGQLTDIIAQYLGLAGMITFDTVADMKLAENLVNGSKCRTLGYNAYNDGGGSYYKIRQVTNDDTIDEKKLIAVYDNLLVAELLVIDNIYPEQIGAYGDETHDDTTSIQYCLNNFKNTILRKNYIITSLTIPENKNLKGTGKLKVKDNHCTNASTSYYIIAMYSNTSIDGLTIDGNKTNNTSYTVADLITTFGDNIKITNNTLINVIDSGIMFSETINSLCDNNIIKDSRDCGIYCNNNSSNKVMNGIISNNKIENSGTSGIALKRGCRFIKVLHNYLSDCSSGITNENASTDTDFSTEFDLIGNTIISSDLSGELGIDTRGGSYLNIKENRIIGYQYGIRVQGSHDVNIDSNYLGYTNTSTATKATIAMILLGRSVTGYNICKNINITNNIINYSFHDSSTYSQRCIDINSSSDTSNINIINNFITSVYATGIRTTTSIGELHIINNVINSSSTAITLQSPALYVNNTITGTETISVTTKFAINQFNEFYVNPVASTPTIQSYMHDGDIIFNKFGTNATVFAWQVDGTNNVLKKVNFDA